MTSLRKLCRHLSCVAQQVVNTWQSRSSIRSQQGQCAFQLYLEPYLGVNSGLFCVTAFQRQCERAPSPSPVERLGVLGRENCRRLPGTGRFATFASLVLIV